MKSKSTSYKAASKIERFNSREMNLYKQESLWKMRKFETIKLAERLYEYTVDYIQNVTEDAKYKRERAIIDGYPVEESIAKEIKEPILHEYLEVLKK